MAGYVRKGPEEPPQWECARGRGVLGGSPHPPHPAGQEAPNLLEEEAERMKQKPESHEGRATRRGRGYTVGYIHSLTTRCRLKSLIASTCCPREMRRSEGRGAAGGGRCYRGGTPSPTSQHASRRSHNQSAHSNRTSSAHHHPI